MREKAAIASNMQELSMVVRVSRANDYRELSR
ncbi:hypothetical protein ACVWXO_007514 [Bradyrhizobium sp. LM2.7]